MIACDEESISAIFHPSLTDLHLLFVCDDGFNCADAQLLESIQFFLPALVLFSATAKEMRDESKSNHENDTKLGPLVTQEPREPQQRTVQGNSAVVPNLHELDKGHLSSRHSLCLCVRKVFLRVLETSFAALCVAFAVFAVRSRLLNLLLQPRHLPRVYLQISNTALSGRAFCGVFFSPEIVGNQRVAALTSFTL